MKGLEKKIYIGSTKIPKSEFMMAVKFVLSSIYFTYNNTIYKQTYGTPMRSPLSPIITDIVIQDLENSVLNMINVQLPFYYRYIDDIIFAIHESSINSILETFNNYHHRLNFTGEMESNCSLSFLDLLIIVENKIKISNLKN